MPPAAQRMVPAVGFCTAPHVPVTAAPAAVLHAWQSLVLEPPQVLLQHTPSAQKPDAQSVPVVHVPPRVQVAPQTPPQSTPLSVPVFTPSVQLRQ